MASGRVVDVGFGAGNVLFHSGDLALEIFGIGKLNFIQRLVMYRSGRLASAADNMNSTGVSRRRLSPAASRCGIECRDAPSLPLSGS